MHSITYSEETMRMRMMSVGLIGNERHVPSWLDVKEETVCESESESSGKEV